MSRNDGWAHLERVRDRVRVLVANNHMSPLAVRVSPRWFVRLISIVEEPFQDSRYARYEKALHKLSKMADPHVAIIAQEALK